MLHAGLDLSRKKTDVCLLSDKGELVADQNQGRHESDDGHRTTEGRRFGGRQRVRS